MNEITPELIAADRHAALQRDSRARTTSRRRRPSAPAHLPGSRRVAGRLARVCPRPAGLPLGRRLPCRDFACRDAAAVSPPEAAAHATTACGRSSQRIRTAQFRPTECAATARRGPDLRLFAAALRRRQRLPAAAPGRSTCRPFARIFPILDQQVHGKPLVWFDNAATTQKPQSVIDAVSRFLRPRQLEHPSRRPHPGRPGDRRLRAGAAEGAGLPGRVVGQGNHLRPRHDRRHQPRRPDLRPEIPAAGRRDRALHARTSRQHRALADGRQGKGRRAAGHSRDRPGRDHARSSTRRCSARGRGSSP